MANNEELKQMILSFRVSELHMLLGFSGRNKSGRKNELQARALELIQLHIPSVNLKIQSLFKSLQQQLQSVTPQGIVPVQPVPETPTPVVSTVAPLAPPVMQPQPNRAGAYGYANQRPTMYVPNAYQVPTYQGRTPNPASSQYPVHPDVRLKALPFYEFLGELLKPSTLVPSGSQRQQESTFVFHLSPQQANAIGMSRDSRPGSKTEYSTQVQLRFCLLETTCEQEDCFPPSVVVKINGKLCPLPNAVPTNKPNVEPKRPPRPVNITAQVKISPLVTNTIQVLWSTDYTRGYVICANLVLKKTSDDLLSRLKNRGIRAADYTRAMIKDKLKEDADSEIATTSLRVSLVCPLGKMRMTTPCRSSTCNHFQCFDASLYLLMNEKKPTWMCPVCDKPATYDLLVIDGYFQEVLASSRLPDDSSEVQLNMDGSWSPLLIVKNKDQQNCVVEKADMKVEPKLEPLMESAQKAQVAKEEEDVSIVTLSDSEEEQPLAFPKWENSAIEPTAPSVNKENLTSPMQAADSPSIIVLDCDSPPTSPAGSAPPNPYTTRHPPPPLADPQGFPRY